MSIISAKKLDFWIEHNYNVLFVGKHGVGKTHTIINAFERNNLKWLYFSASTLDPFVDLIGVPKEVVDEDGNRYLDLVRPKALQNDEVEAIFFDEYNRSKPKVRNAVMELIQFKSINGKKFNNLKVIWAAINPDDGDEDDPKYDVEVLDPAQKDRFHVILNVPYSVDKQYLKSKYGDAIASGAVEWWNGLTKELKELCSPRRLDYALDVYNNGGDMYDVLDKKLNVGKLIQQLKSGSYASSIKDMYSSKDKDAAEKFFSNVNNQDGALQYIKSKKEYVDFFMPFYPKETLSKLLDDPKWTKLLLTDSLRSNIESIVQEKLKFLYTNKKLATSDNKTINIISMFNEYLGDGLKETNELSDSLMNRFMSKLDDLDHKITYRRTEALEDVSFLAPTILSMNCDDDMVSSVSCFLAGFCNRSQIATINIFQKELQSIIYDLAKFSEYSYDDIVDLIVDSKLGINVNKRNEIREVLRQ